MIATVTRLQPRASAKAALKAAPPGGGGNDPLQTNVAMDAAAAQAQEMKVRAPAARGGGRIGRSAMLRALCMRHAAHVLPRERISGRGPRTHFLRWARGARADCARDRKRLRWGAA